MNSSLINADERDHSSTSLDVGTYFVLRRETLRPNGILTKNLESENLHSWFTEQWKSKHLKQMRKYWRKGFEGFSSDSPPNNDHSLFYEATQEIFGTPVEEFWNVWQAILMGGENPPDQGAEFLQFLKSIRTVESSRHALQCIGNDEDVDVAWYLFDHEFKQKQESTVAFLLHDRDWDSVGDCNEIEQGLFLGHGENIESLGKHGSPGTLYCCFFSSACRNTIYEMTGSYRVTGTRLPEFGVHLKSKDVPVHETVSKLPVYSWPKELVLLRAELIKTGADHFQDSVSILSRQGGLRGHLFLNEIYKNFDSDHSFLRSSRNIEKDLLTLSAHQTATEITLASKVHSYDHLFVLQFTISTPMSDPRVRHYLFFDDLWAANYPSLAESILRLGCDWRIFPSMDDEEAL